MRRSPAPSSRIDAARPRAGRVAATAALTLATVGGLAVPASSVAAPALGSTVLTLSPSAPRSLRAPGFSLAPAGNASGSARLVGLAVTSVGPGSRPLVRHAAADGVRFRVGSRSVLLRDLRITLSGRARVEARVGRSRVAVLALSNVQVRGSADTARSFTARVSLTAAGVRRLRAGLRVPRLRAGKLGTLRVGLTAPAASSAAGSAPGPAAPESVAPAAPATPASPAPAPAVPENTTPSLDWTVRSSWLGYLSAGNGTATADGGATRTASGSFLLPAAGGTVDAAGVGTIEQSGSVRFRQAGHGIDMEYSAFVVHLDGTPRPRITALYTDRNTAVGGAPIEVDPGDGSAKRITLGTLDLAEPTVTITRENGQYVVRRAPILLSAEAAKPYSFYHEGDAFGAMTLRAPLAP